MAPEPQASLILPSHNRAALLPAAICSVLAQTFQDFELIVVDDGSTDGTHEVLAVFRDARIRMIRLEQQAGAAAARNAGVAQARGDWIGFMDSDLQWAPEKLERQFRALKSAPEHVGAVFCAHWLREGGRLHRVPSPGLQVPAGGWVARLLQGNLVDTSALLVRSHLLRDIGGFDPEMPRFQDWDLALRLCRVTEFQFLDEPLYLSTRYQDSISMNAPAAVAALRLLQRKHAALLGEDPRLMARFKGYTAHFACLAGHPGEARDLLREIFRAGPFGAEMAISYLLSFLPVRIYQAVVQAKDRSCAFWVPKGPPLPSWLERALREQAHG